MFNPKTFTLENGLEFVVVENHRAPVVEQMVWYRVGAADERPGESGLAHFLEHLMFKGTETVKPQEFSKIIARNGGEDNAFTTDDYTAYFEKIAKDKLELVMGLEADRMQNLRLTNKEVLPEREVVREERRMRVDNRPEAVLNEQSEAQFWLNSPYGRPTIGWPFEIEALTTAKALAFYHRHYMPNNAVVVIAGDVTPDEVKKIAERTFGKVPGGTAPERDRPSEPEHRVAMRTSMTSDQVREPSWSRSFMAPELPHRQGPAPALRAAGAGGDTGRQRHQPAVQEPGGREGHRQRGRRLVLAQPVRPDRVLGLRQPARGHRRRQAGSGRRRRDRRIKAGGVTAAEVDDAKTSIVASAIYAQDSLSAAPNWIGRALMTGSSLDDIEAWPDRIKAVTADEVNAAARAVLLDDHSMTATLLPAEGGPCARPAPEAGPAAPARAAHAAGPGRGELTRLTHARALAALAAIALLAIALPARAMDIQQVTSPKHKIVAWLVEDHSVPVISLSVAFRGGAALDPKGKDGLAEFASDLMDEGAGDLDSQAYHKALERIAASVRFDAGPDNFSGSLRTLSARRDRAFELFRMALAAPRFDPEPVARVRAQLLSSLREREQRPNYIAQRLFYRTIFPDHPYGAPVDGTLETVPNITAADMKAFVARRLARDNLVVGVVGDISAQELATRLDDMFGALPATSAPRDVPEATYGGAGKLQVVNKPIPQSIVVFGEPGIKRTDPDWYAALLMDQIFGSGNFSSRLMEEVREKRGLAYGVSAGLAPYRHGALIVGGVATRNAKVAESIKVIRAEWKRMEESGATATELANAKTYINGSFPLSLDSSRRIASILVTVQLEELGIDYLNKRAEIIDAVTLEQVNKAAQRLLKPGLLTFVVVGNPEGRDRHALSRERQIVQNNCSKSEIFLNKL